MALKYNRSIVFPKVKYKSQGQIFKLQFLNCKKFHNSICGFMLYGKNIPKNTCWLKGQGKIFLISKPLGMLITKVISNTLKHSSP